MQSVIMSLISGEGPDHSLLAIFAVFLCIYIYMYIYLCVHPLVYLL